MEPAGVRPARRGTVVAVWAVAVGSAVCVAAAVPPAVVNWRTLGPGSVYVVNALVGVLVPPAGAFVLARRPGHRIGLVLLSAAGLGVSFLALSWADYALRSRPGALPGAEWAALVAGATWTPFLALITLLPLWFPDGRPAGRFWTVAERVLLVVLVAVPVLSLLEPRVALGLAANPLVTGPRWVTPLVEGLVVGCVFAAAFVCVPAAVVTYLRGDDGERVRLRWFLLAAAVVAASMFVPGPPVSDVLTGLALGLAALAITVAVVRHRLWGVEPALHRTLVLGTVALCLLLVYVGVVGLADRVLPEGAALLGAATVALVLAPLLSRVKRMARTLIHGDRDDPYAALTRLAERLEANLDPEDVPGAALAEVRTALRVPYVALRVHDGQADGSGGECGTESVLGRRPGDGRAVETVPLLHQGTPVGELHVATRRPGEPLTARDQVLLADLARPLAATVQAAVLRSELRRSREALVEALERERRRLRADLHDGVGPSLAALVLALDGIAHAARGADPARAVPDRVDAVKSEVRDVIGELRRIVDALRPPALDELGLAGALDRYLTTFRHTDSAPRFVVESGLDGTTLPAAVEVAAYRITSEAITNVLRHAAAGRCSVRLTLDGPRLCLEIEDDGAGGAAPGGGTGLASMSERARSLGGTLEVLPGVPTGTLVRAVLPVGGARSGG